MSQQNPFSYGYEGVGGSSQASQSSTQPAAGNSARTKEDVSRELQKLLKILASHENSLYYLVAATHEAMKTPHLQVFAQAAWHACDDITKVDKFLKTQIRNLRKLWRPLQRCQTPDEIQNVGNTLDGDNLTQHDSQQLDSNARRQVEDREKAVKLEGLTKKVHNNLKLLKADHDEYHQQLVDPQQQGQPRLRRSHGQGRRSQQQDQYPSQQAQYPQQQAQYPQYQGQYPPQ
ncbi:hypothetical protein B0H66DRAFT_623019 [Apodospora peruviana]|uniref:Uncharacterized protein n=1 Tax=Apodospora peruviana TaxID=516989 RepID=A0AAE0M4B1_9PEZI|nr:hypothetical protein B0H66DRAFT_623019 [Apodospora peruviana]